LAVGEDLHGVPSYRGNETSRNVVVASLVVEGRVLSIRRMGIELRRVLRRLTRGEGQSRMFVDLLRGEYGLHNPMLTGNGMAY